VALRIGRVGLAATESPERTGPRNDGGVRRPKARPPNKEMQLTRPDGSLVGGRGAYVRHRRAIVVESGLAADLRCSADMEPGAVREGAFTQHPVLGHTVLSRRLDESDCSHSCGVVAPRAWRMG
jgi:hypothetical protein